MEVIGEITVMSNMFTAEFGGIANIRVSTRRGSSQYHGSLFYDNKNSALAAWDLRDKLGQMAFTPNAAQSAYPSDCSTALFSICTFRLARTISRAHMPRWDLRTSVPSISRRRASES